MSEAAPINVTPGTPNSAAPGNSVPPSGAPNPATGSSATPAPDWISGFKNETVRAAIQENGFKDTETLAEAYVNLRKLAGGGPDNLLKLPAKPDDKDAWDNVYSKLGRPASPDLYKLETKGADENFLKVAKGMFHEAGLNQSQAEKMTAKWNDYVTNAQKAQLDAQSAQNAQEKVTLEKEWGKAFSDNVSMAKRAAQSFGLDAPTIDKLESALGFAGVMKLMHNIGSKMGEDTFQSGTGNRGIGALTPQDAKNRITYLRSDPAFVKAYTAGGKNELAEMERLHSFAYPEGQ